MEDVRIKEMLDLIIEHGDPVAVAENTGRGEEVLEYFRDLLVEDEEILALGVAEREPTAMWEDIVEWDKLTISRLETFLEGGDNDK